MKLKIHLKPLLLLVIVAFVSITAQYTYAQNNINPTTIKELQQAYKQNPEIKTYAYKLAVAYAKINNSDSAFYFLMHLPNSKMPNKDALLVDCDLQNLHTDKRWKLLENTLDSIYLANNPCKDATLSLQIKNMGLMDQQFRSLVDYTLKQPMNKNIWDSISKIQIINDSLNLIKFKTILSKYGWPGNSIVGKTSNQSFGLIALHAPQQIQEQCLPLLKDKAKNNEANWETYATMFDRILIYKGEKQFYGTQLRYNEQTGEEDVLPIEDKANVDKRRKEMGLTPILESYTNELGFLVPPPKIADK